MLLSPFVVSVLTEFYKNLWREKKPKRDAQLAILRRPELVAARAARLRGLDTGAVRPLPPAAPRGGRTDRT